MTLVKSLHNTILDITTCFKLYKTQVVSLIMAEILPKIGTGETEPARSTIMKIVGLKSRDAVL